MTSWLRSRWLRRALQVFVTLGAFAYLYTRIDRVELGRALASVTASAWLVALLLTAASLAGGVVRWWLLFRGFGAPRPPTLTRLSKHYIVGFFYNTYLPGGVTGDLVRGYAARDAWPEGHVGALATVLVERALGLCALLGVTATATLLHPLPGMRRLVWPAFAAFALGCLATLALALSGRLAGALAGPLARLSKRLPVPTAWLPLWAALLASLITQLCPAFAGYVLIHSIDPAVSLSDALTIVPLASAAAFLPISVSGAGVRETLFVTLFGLVGVPAQAALAGSLSLWFAQAALAAIGGAYAWALGDDDAPRRAPDSA